VRRRHFCRGLRESLELKANPGSLFVLLLVQPSGFAGQQFAEGQIALAQPVRLVDVDVIADEAQDVRSPDMALGLVLADVFGEQRLIVGGFFRSPSRLVLPPSGASLWLSIRRSSKFASSSPVTVSFNPSIIGLYLLRRR
jgi:hypothetical protein